MINPIDVIEKRIQSHYCILQYHKHKEWVIFGLLAAIIIFLITWSSVVNFELCRLEDTMKQSETLHDQLVESQITIIEQIEATNHLPPEIKQKLSVIKNNFGKELK